MLPQFKPFKHLLSDIFLDKIGVSLSF